MTALDIARRFAQMKQPEEARRAYQIFLHQEGEKDPREELEAASYIFYSKGDYKAAYTVFVSLYNRGLFQEELWNIMVPAFYLPNVEKLQKQYEAGCRALKEYPYCFRKDFPAFEDLPLLFFPFDEKGFLPFFKAENRFGEYVNFNDPVIDRYFFQDLEKPVLAEDVYSQYQLEYLNDNVRKSEWVARENHIYLHYTDWPVFCAHLQCLSLPKLLREEKLVFLFEEEIAQYPIDFKERFGVDYSRYPLKPVGIREINRLIWHTQLATHNGGDFFNEILYGHPNLLALESVMLENITKVVKELRRGRLQERRLDTALQRELAQLKHPTEKDVLVAYFLSEKITSGWLDPAARIAPALLFQPHFENMLYRLHTDEREKAAVLTSPQYDEIRSSPIFRQFKYIKTFTPLRRPTTSYGATVRFMLRQVENSEKPLTVSDNFSDRLLNRSFLVDERDRLYRDSVLVRFEDGKLNPKATFTALAEFLDLPYTESMTYCSGRTGLNPESLKGNDRGFDPAAIYRTYDDFVDDADRALLEYFLRDVYEAYGYDFHYYKGEPVDLDWVKEKLDGIRHLDGFIAQSTAEAVRQGFLKKGVPEEEAAEIGRREGEKQAERCRENRLRIMEVLLKNLYFINQDGQPLRMMKPLPLDPALLEQPLYR